MPAILKVMQNVQYIMVILHDLMLCGPWISQAVKSLVTLDSCHVSKLNLMVAKMLSIRKADY